MKIRTRAATAGVIAVLALSTATATAGSATAQPATPASPSASIELPAELRGEIQRQGALLNTTEVSEGSEEWAFAVAAAGRAIIAGARAAGPVVFNALKSAVRAGYSSFNSWCNRNFLCGAAAGVGLNEVYQWLRDNL
ncbi:hypothetical protein [Rhodococcus sp. NPDC076796]|uniref:hypothetical protein n=1 Tax=Rhodococcus sp. NPDC076796 TaxID=3154859 RepID=UPI00344F6B1D